MRLKMCYNLLECLSLSKDSTRINKNVDYFKYVQNKNKYSYKQLLQANCTLLSYVLYNICF